MKTITLFITSCIFCITFLHANVIVVNGLTHSYAGVSGQSFQGEVVLVNPTELEQRVLFSLSEAVYDCTTGRTFKEDYVHKNSSSNWFNGSSLDKVLAPKEKYIFKYSITIPNDAMLKGSYWTTLMINVDKPIREESANGIGLNTKMRYAIRLLTDVNVKEVVEIDFSNIELKLNTQNRTRELAVKILNETVFIENVKLVLEVYDANGNKILETETKRLAVFPEVCRDFIVDVSGLPNGNYQCIILANSREEFVGTNIDLTIE